MFDAGRPSLFTIGLEHPFVDALVEGILERFDTGPLDLARGLLILPNHRAQLAVRDAFVRRKGAATLLPRMVVVGDGDLDEAAGAAFDAIDSILPPAIAPVARQYMLAERIRHVRPDASVGEALRDAGSLAQVIDQLLVEDLPLDAFATAIADEVTPLARHWHEACGLALDILNDWPAQLAAAGVIERTAQRNLLLERTRARWVKDGLPAPWVIAAGITTSAPAIAALLGVVARAQGGAVVLPHLDLGMPAAQWVALGDDPRQAASDDTPPHRADEGHPYYHLKLLLDRMGCHRDEVQPWQSAEQRDQGGTREVFIRHMIAAAQFTDDWPMVPAAERKLPGVTLCDCATPAEEALTIALAMRETLEVPGKTAALITPDRGIAARVAAILARWGISADDSAGVPLQHSATGSLLVLLAACQSSRFAPHDLIALLNHPLVQAGEARRLWIDQVRALDKLLRGPRLAAGLDAVTRHIKAADKPELAAWWEEVTPLLAKLDDMPEAGRSLTDTFALLQDSLAALAGETVWAGADGRELSRWIAEHTQHATLFTAPVLAKDVHAIVISLMSGVTIRSAYRGHQRLFIWGLIEARLQRADRMILAGLNEGQWPVRGQPDPWLAPVLRARLGLPQAERQAGLAAHDFISALGGAEVIVTRALRDGSAPTVASRLRLRIDALMGDSGIAAASHARWRDWARALNRVALQTPAARPNLMPPAHRRPQRLSVTEVDTLLVDPFAFYARNALGLKAWDALDADPTIKWRGTAVHDVLKDWLKAGVWSIEAIDAQLERLLADPGLNAIMRVIWAPRLRQALHSFVKIIHQDIAEGRKPITDASEARKRIDVAGVTLTGMPDRIDRMGDDTLAVVDYKTGSNPTKAMVDGGYALQLGLLGWMAEQGVFTQRSQTTSRFEYWRVNRKQGGEIGWVDVPFYKASAKRTPNITPENFVAEAEATLLRLIAQYFHGDAPFVAKRVPEFAIYGDYDQLMRLEEWYGALMDGDSA